MEKIIPLLHLTMRYVLNIITLLLVSLYSMSVPVTWGLYYLQADVVAATYCENPEKPSCHGKCHVAKLTSKQSSESDLPPLVELNPEKPLLYFTEICEHDASQVDAPLSYFVDQSRGLQRGYPSDIFHPPALLA